MTHQTLSAEHYSHKVTAEYDSHSAADQAISALEDRAELPSSQIQLVEPGDPDMAHKVEPESKGIAGLLVKSHFGLGLGGLAFGLALAAVLVLTGPAITRSSPVMTFIALGFIFPILGLLLAGVISLRPDHDPMIAKTRSAASKGRWTVVAHCVSAEQQKRVKDTIGHSVQTL
jgi:hypothetical protein